MRIEGSCNLCGACCIGKNGERCENLEIFSAVGMPFATRCKAYSKRYNAMPIVMIARDGSRIVGQYHCALNSPPEVRAVAEQIRKGVCPMRIVP